MVTLYNAHAETREYLPGCDSEARENPKYSQETHAAADQYIYNPRTQSLDMPPMEGENQKACLVDEEWILTADYREQTFWDISTKERNVITELGVEPETSWTDQEPATIYQIWDGSAWVDDLALWLDLIVRPERDSKLVNSDKYMIIDYPITETIQAEWATYRQELRDLPGIFSDIVDPIPWPVPPTI